LWGSYYDDDDCNDVRLTDGNVVSFWRDKNTKTFELTLDQPPWGAMPDNGQPIGYVMTVYNLTAIVYPDGSKDIFSYDENGNMAGLADREGNT
jgi:YD repeat-containing protein